MYVIEWCSLWCIARISFVLPHILHQIQFGLIVLKVVTALLDGASLQVFGNFDKVLAIILKALDVNLLLVGRPLVSTWVGCTTTGLVPSWVVRVRVSDWILYDSSPSLVPLSSRIAACCHWGRLGHNWLLLGCLGQVWSMVVGVVHLRDLVWLHHSTSLRQYHWASWLLLNTYTGDGRSRCTCCHHMLLLDRHDNLLLCRLLAVANQMVLVLSLHWSIREILLRVLYHSHCVLLVHVRVWLLMRRCLVLRQELLVALLIIKVLLGECQLESTVLVRHLLLLLLIRVHAAD